MAFAAGVAPDIDHIMDFVIDRRRITRYREMYETMLRVDVKRIYLVFHTIELVIVLWICIIAFSLNKYWIAVAVGFTQHLLLDCLGNPVTPLGYFFTYRVRHRFIAEKIVEKHKLKG